MKKKMKEYLKATSVFLFITFLSLPAVPSTVYAVKPQVRDPFGCIDAAPRPVIYHPDDGSWGSGLVGISVIEKVHAEDIVCTIFEYSADGEQWHEIDVDYDGRSNTFPHETYDPSWDGWSTVWDTTDVAEGWYYIRATMVDRSERTGHDQIMIYIDPTPPSPVIVRPIFDQVINGVFRLAASSQDEDIAGVIFSIFKVRTSSPEIEKDMPFTPQGFGCSPASVAASLLWFDRYKNDEGKRPFDGLVPENLEDPRALTEELNRRFRTRNIDPPGQIGVHHTEDGDMIAGTKDFVKDHDFVVKAIGRLRAGAWVDPLPQGINWVEYYKTMLPHEDVVLCLTAINSETGRPWGHCVTANSFRPNYEIWWTPEGCIWAQVPPYIIDVMDHNESDEYRELTMEEDGDIRGLEEYYNVHRHGQRIEGMMVVSPKKRYDELKEVLEKFAQLPSDWRPIGPGRPLPEVPELKLYHYDWDTTTVNDGSYLLMATMMDQEGNQASDIIWINVNNNGVRILTPDGGETLFSGSPLTIEWLARCEAASYDVDYSCDHGATWRRVAGNVMSRRYNWRVPTLEGPTAECLMKVTAYDRDGEQVGQDISDSTFLIRSVAPPRGRHTLTVRVFVDYRCDTFYNRGVDRPIAGARVAMTFHNGATIAKETGRLGLVYFHGFDPMQGVHVRVELPNYRGRPLEICRTCHEEYMLGPEDFGPMSSKWIEFRARISHPKGVEIF